MRKDKSKGRIETSLTSSPFARRKIETELAANFRPRSREGKAFAVQPPHKFFSARRAAK
jgi:hypothetical protein